MILMRQMPYRANRRLRAVSPMVVGHDLGDAGDALLAEAVEGAVNSATAVLARRAAVSEKAGNPSCDFSGMMQPFSVCPVGSGCPPPAIGVGGCSAAVRQTGRSPGNAAGIIPRRECPLPCPATRRRSSSGGSKPPGGESAGSSVIPNRVRSSSRTAACVSANTAGDKLAAPHSRIVAHPSATGWGSPTSRMMASSAARSAGSPLDSSFMVAILPPFIVIAS